MGRSSLPSEWLSVGFFKFDDCKSRRFKIVEAAMVSKLTLLVYFRAKPYCSEQQGDQATAEGIK